MACGRRTIPQFAAEMTALLSATSHLEQQTRERRGAAAPGRETRACVEVGSQRDLVSSLPLGAQLSLWRRERQCTGQHSCSIGGVAGDARGRPPALFTAARGRHDLQRGTLSLGCEAPPEAAGAVGLLEDMMCEQEVHSQRPAAACRLAAAGSALL